MLPAIYISISYQLYSMTVFFIFSFLASIFYHFCDTQLYCLAGLSYHSLQVGDFWGAFNALAITILYLGNYQSFLKDILPLVLAFLLLIPVVNDATSVVNLTIVIPLAVILAFIHPLYRLHELSREMYKSSFSFQLFLKFLKNPFNFNLYYFVSALLMVSTGATIYTYLETGDNYAWTHSVWHICAFLSIYLFIKSRTQDAYIYVSSEEEDEEGGEGGGGGRGSEGDTSYKFLK